MGYAYGFCKSYPLRRPSDDGIVLGLRHHFMAPDGEAAKDGNLVQRRHVFRHIIFIFDIVVFAITLFAALVLVGLERVDESVSLSQDNACPHALSWGLRCRS